MKNNKVLAIIPARGGSKGIPRKNIKNFNGKPLIAYTIEIALKCPSIDKVIVSTDDKEIIEIAKKYGAEVPFIRPEYLSTDSASSIDVVRHATNFFEENNEHYENIILLEPTSPLRNIEDIENAITEIKKDNVDTVVGVTQFEIDSSDIMIKDSEGYIKPYENIKKLNVRRQDDKTNKLIINGGIYAIKYNVLFDPKTKIFNPYGENSYLKTKIILMPKERSIEIDNMIQFKLAELIMKEGISKNG